MEKSFPGREERHEKGLRQKWAWVVHAKEKGWLWLSLNGLGRVVGDDGQHT